MIIEGGEGKEKCEWTVLPPSRMPGTESDNAATVVMATEDVVKPTGLLRRKNGAPLVPEIPPPSFNSLKSYFSDHKAKLPEVKPKEKPPKEMSPKEVPPKKMSPKDLLSMEMPPKPKEMPPKELPPKEIPPKVLPPREMPPPVQPVVSSYKSKVCGDRVSSFSLLVRIVLDLGWIMSYDRVW